MADKQTTPNKTSEYPPTLTKLTETETPIGGMIAIEKQHGQGENVMLNNHNPFSLHINYM